MWLNLNLMTHLEINSFPTLGNKNAYSEIGNCDREASFRSLACKVSAWSLKNILVFSHTCSFVLSLGRLVPEFCYVPSAVGSFDTIQVLIPSCGGFESCLLLKAPPYNASASFSPTYIGPKTLQRKLENSVQWLVNTHC